VLARRLELPPAGLLRQRLRAPQQGAAELTSTTIASAGLGARFVLSTYVNLQLDYGHVTKAGATTRADANRLHVRLGLAY
jgi:hemolysin activation/secretion protein